MSEYQYYEFQALDQPLSREDQEQLRAISSRARITDLLHRLRNTMPPAATPGTRSAAQLLDAAHTWRTERRQRAEHERAKARAQRLTALADEAEPTWQQVEAHIATKKTSSYDAAVTLLAELRDAYAHTGRDTDFQQRLTRMRDTYQRRPGLIHRLDRHSLR